jgi:sarcosine oxidase subunit beta
MKDKYRIVIVGGGIQGLSCAYYLAKRGVSDVLVVDRGYCGGGASGRNTAIVHARYNSPAWINLVRESIRLYETLSQEIDYNVMFAQRGSLLLAHSENDLPLYNESVKRQNSLGVPSRILTQDEVTELVPDLNTSDVVGGLFQPDGGTVRHDAVVWGYAEAARRMGVDIQMFTELNGIRLDANAVTSVITTKGEIQAEYVVNAAGPYGRVIAEWVDVKLPNVAYRLEAFVTESLKPFLHPIVVSKKYGFYCNQTDRGEFLASGETGRDPTSSIRSSTEKVYEFCRAAVQLFPKLKHVKMLRAWAGSFDVTPDYAPLLGPVDNVKGFILDCGWSRGVMAGPIGGKILAEYILDDHIPDLMEPFLLNRYATGQLIDEKLHTAIVAGAH